ncbi:MAG: hypothetical protein M1339_07405, partial [Bacteroidetes bacterium]|nr:hypothetical protein [Bacteroidota bacterium]
MKKKSAGIIFIGILATAFFGCSKFKVGSFVMPSWNTQLSAPIFDRTYTLGEILYKDSIVVSNGDTTFITPLGPASEFTLFSAKPTNGTTFAGKLTLGADSASYSVIDPSILVGQSAPVPPMPAHSATLMPALPFGNFDYASVASGILRITVKNECPASLLFQNGIDVVDSSNGQWIFNIPIPGDSLAPNQSYTVSKSLAGIVIPNDPELRFTYSSPGSASPQTYSTDTLLTVSFTSSDIIASSVSGAVHLKDPVAIPSDTVSFNLGDFGKEFSGPATFGDSTKLTLNFNLTDGFPLLMHLSVVPSSKSVVDPSPDSAVVEEMIYPGQSNSVCFGPDLVSALNKYSASYQRIPDEFIFSGYVIVNPGPPYANGTISENDKVDGTGIVSVPFDVGIASAVIADTTKSHGELAPAISDSATASKLA